MTATILVVDDLLPNVKLLETKLLNEYYTVLTARSGAEALTILKNSQVDLVLLDVMMPEMDGFEVCRFIKSDPEITNIPVVMVTALSEIEDRVAGLESGADDFLTKPINDMALFARIRSLIRTKRMLDELKLRDQSRNLLGISSGEMKNYSLKEAKLLLIDDDEIENKNLKGKLSHYVGQVDSISDPNVINNEIYEKNYDLFIISSQMTNYDGLRVCSQIKAQKSIRHVPCLLMVEDGDSESIIKGLDLGVSDYITTPIDINEMLARASSQVKRKKYQEELVKSYEDSLSMSVTDALTGVHNRRYFDVHFERLAQVSREGKKELGMIMMDIDRFKKVNDENGHMAGDEILKQIAKIIFDSVRITDLVSRFGGEEFIILLPNTSEEEVVKVAERIRQNVESHPFVISEFEKSLSITSSFGVSSLNPEGPISDCIKRADANLYKAKELGRNKVCSFSDPSSS